MTIRTTAGTGVDLYVSDFGIHEVAATEWIAPDTDVEKHVWYKVDADQTWIEQRLQGQVETKWEEGLEATDYDLSEIAGEIILKAYDKHKTYGYRFAWGNEKPNKLFADGFEILINKANYSGDNSFALRVGGAA
jgi:hypothetical protein